MILKKTTEILKNYSGSNSDDGENEPEMLEKVTTSKLSKIITDCSGMKESLHEFIYDAPELKKI